MNILHIIPTLGKGGAERLVIDLLGELKKDKDIQVRLVIFRDKIEHSVEEIRDIICIIPSSIKLSFWKKNKLDVESLQSFLDEFKPDIIHSHLFEAEIVSRSCSYPKAKWFSHFHDNMIQFENLTYSTITSKRKLTDFIEKRYLFRRYRENGNNHFITVSKDTYSYACGTCGKYSVTMLPNGIDTIKFDRRINHPTDKIRIINIGTFTEKKNQVFLISIAEKLRELEFDFEIVMLGDGRLRNKVVVQVAANKLDNCFVFTGAVNNTDDFLNDSNIYVHTAMYEPFGLVLLEAMACKLPVITLDGGGNRDLIEEGKNGFMIEKENPDLFVEKILFLWNNKAEYQRISEYAKNFAKKYDIRDYVKSLIDLYKA